MKVFNISETDFLDASKIKIIDGIAGAGKSSQIDNFFKSKSIDYLRLTSTNTLKDDSIRRYGGTVKTICAGLFDNSEGFRHKEKEPQGFRNIVLDEILQDGSNALEWVEHHADGVYNIIATTDSHQMIAQEDRKKVLKQFQKLIHSPNVIYINIGETLRGIDQTTREEVKRLYNSEKDFAGAELMKLYPVVEFPEFKKENVYLTHTKEIEHELYKRYDLSDCDLIGKGRMSGKVCQRGKYPLYDELTAETQHVRYYYQARNIATPTRYQGNEILPGNTGYYFIESSSVITAREFYTVASRFKNLQDLKLVCMDKREKMPEIKQLNGQEVRKKAFLILKEEFTGETQIITDIEISQIVAKHNDSSCYYSIDWIYARGKDGLYIQYLSGTKRKQAEAEHDREENTTYILKKPERIKYQKTIGANLCKRTPSIQFDFIPKIYEVIGRTFKAPAIANPPEMIREEFNRQIDIAAAYPTMIKFCKMPTNKALYFDYDPARLNWYICNSSKLTGKDNLITEDLAQTLHFEKCIFKFSTEFQISNETGDYLLNKARKSQEDKKEVSKINYGYFEKHYIEKIRTVDNEGRIFWGLIKQPTNIHELFMCAIKSALCDIMLNALKSIDGQGYVITDAIHYKGDKMPELPPFCWYRVSEGNKGDDGQYKDVISQNYELKSKKQLESERRAARRKEWTEEQREADRAAKREARKKQTPEQRARENERLRQYRARKKVEKNRERI